MVQCYYKNDAQPNLIRSINSGVCEGSGSAAGFFSCCFPWDLCLPDGLCYANANSTSTYYTALCTDETLLDDACQKGCDGRYRTGVRYNETDNLWACCDSGDTSCSTVNNATFQAEAPDELRLHTMTIVDFIPTATGASTAATSTSHSTSTMSADPSSTASNQIQKSGSSLSTGAIAGISVGIALAVIALLACIWFWLMKKRQRNRAVTTDVHSRYHDSVEKHGVGIVEAPTSYQYHYDQRKNGVRTNATGLYELT